jgi:hypothetical protein
MRNCTWEEIEQLLHKYPDARKIAVENFLSTVANCETVLNACLCLQQDARAYHWNAQTVLVIKDGIKLVSK